MKKQATIYIAGGCFWGTEHFLKQINGVVETTVGYANGYTESPTYEEVCTDKTGFVEAVKVIYNPDLLPLGLLLQLFFKTIDPTSLNQQGGDVGTQYRTGIYFTDPMDEPLIERELHMLEQHYDKPIMIELLPLNNFYDAENYHQNYLEKNPNGYCHIPKALFELAHKANR